MIETADTSGRSGPGAQDPRGACTVVVRDATGRLAAPILAWLRDKAGAALARLGAAGDLRVRVVADAEMAAAHLEFADEAGTTDVLTFDESDPPSGAGGPLDADILICLDEAERQSAGRGHGPERELLLYIVHGVLHCLGHDDHDEGAAAAMHRREDEVLTAIGVGPTYGTDERKDDR